MEKTTCVKTQLKLYFAAAGLSVLITAAVSALMGFYPFGESSLLTGDLHGTYLAYMSGYRDMLLEGKSLFFTFSKQLGGSLYNFFIPYLFTPLNYLYALFPVTSFPVLALFIWIFRIGLSALACAWALRYFNSKIPDCLLLCLSVCYSLLGYEIAYNQINDWHFFIVILPVLCVLTDRFIAEGRFSLYAVTLFFTVLHFYYLAYMVCIFLAVFFFFRLFVRCEAVPAGERGRVYLKKTAGFVGVSLLSVLATSFYLIPTIIGASADKGGLFKLSLELGLNYNPLEIISKLFVGSFAWDNIVDGGPILYCGLICVPLLLLYYQNTGISRREKAASLGVFAFFLVVTENETLNIILHGGSPPTWFPYRYSFVISFFIIFIAARAASVPFAISKKRALINGAVFFALAAAAYLFTENLPSIKRIALSLALLLVYLFFFYLNGGGKRRPALGLLVVLAVSAELLLNTYFTLNVFEYYDYGGFCGFIESNGTSLDSIEDEGFCRVDKTYNRTLNDSFWLNYYGNSVFTSQADITQRFSELLGYGRNLYARGSTAFADALLSFKYLLSDDEYKLPAHYDALNADLEHPVYKSRYTLPLCFLCGDGAASVDINAYENTFEMQNAMLRSLTGVHNDCFLPLAPSSREFDGESNSGTVSLRAPCDLYAYAFLEIVASNGVELAVNGKALGKYGAADFDGVINLGEFKEGDVISFSFDFYDESAAATKEYFYYLDRDRFEEALSSLSEKPSEITLVEDGRVELTAAAEDGDMLCTSLLYSPYWEITVNGRRTSGTMLFDSLLGVELESGANEVTIHYVPPSFRLSLAVSGAAALLLILLCLQRRKK